MNMKTGISIEILKIIHDHFSPEEWGNTLAALKRAELMPVELLPLEEILYPNAKMDKKFQVLSLGELLTKDFPADMWRIEGILPVNGQGIISGTPGVGKSWVLAEVVRSVALGISFLGKYPVTQAKVLVIDEDMGVRELKRRWEMLPGTADIKDRVFFAAFTSLRLDNREDTSLLKNIVEEKGIGLLVIDPLIGMHGFEENSSTEMRVFFNQFQKLKESGVTILFAHHSRKKSPGSRGDSLEDMRGSSDIGGAIESHLAITEDDGCLVITQTKNRNAEKIAPFKIRLIEKTGKIEFRHEGAYDAKKKKKEQAKELILDILEEANESLSVKEIRQNLEENGVGKTAIEEALKELRENGEIQGRYISGRGRALFYSLPGGGIGENE